MNWNIARAIARPLLVTSLALSLAACGGGGAPAEDHGKEAGDPAAEPEKGTHGGRLLRQGDFALEIAIFEDNQPPQYWIWATKGGKPIDPRQFRAAVTLRRLGGEVNRFEFQPSGDHLAGLGVVEEPHSFDVEVVAFHGGKRYRWTYPSYEGRTTLTPEAARQAGIKIERAGPATIGEIRELIGTVALAPSAQGEVRAQFPGPIKALYKQVGQRVRRGELIARVESNESLQTYPVYAPISGVVAERNNVGDVAIEEPLYRIIDPAATIVQFNVFPRDLELIEPGQPVVLQTLDGGPVANGRLSGFVPQSAPGTATGTAVVQVSLPNPTGKWRPGMALKGIVTVNGRQVSLAVRTKALQRFRDWTVVFANYGENYEIRPLELGKQTPEWTEVTSGIKPGTPYVTDGAFLIRADIEKSGASHDH